MDAATALNGRAWLFSLPQLTEMFTEFVEWPASADPPIIEQQPLSTALQKLNDVFPNEESDTWQQAGF